MQRMEEGMGINMVEPLIFILIGTEYYYVLLARWRMRKKVHGQQYGDTSSSCNLISLMFF